MKANVFILIQVVCLLMSVPGLTLAGEPAIGMLIEKEHTATYLETLEGFRDELVRSEKHYRFIEKNAMKDRKAMKTIAEEFSADPDIETVVVLGSAAATIANRHIKSKPVIFGGINHPGGLGISGDNITGTTYYIDPSTVVNLITRINPAIRKVGILYEPPEQNAASIIEVPETESALREHGISIIKEKVLTKEDIVEKTRSVLEAGAEYIIIPTNRLLYSNIRLIRKVSDSQKVPVVSFSRKGVVDGALIALTSNNKLLGGEMARMLIDIIEKVKSPKEIQWYFPSKYSILVNEETRSDLGVQIPKKIYGIATLLNSHSKTGEK